jgi:hypothetical protein
MERIRLVEDLTDYHGFRLIASPPLRIDTPGVLKYTINRTYPEKKDFRIPWTLINYTLYNFGKEEVPWGVIWMTDTLSGDFLILWGLHHIFPSAETAGVDVMPSWWAKRSPWCCIMDKPEGQQMSFLEFFEQKCRELLRPSIPSDKAKKLWISTRPTGLQVYLQIKPVDFLERRAFDLQIQTLSLRKYEVERSD